MRLFEPLRTRNRYGTSGDPQPEIGLPVDDDPIAEKTRHALHRGREVNELIARVEASILDDQRDIEGPRRELGDRLARVVDDEEPGEAPVHLLARPPVGMRVIPVGASRSLDLELVDVLAPSGDRLAGMSVGRPRDVQSVPVHDRLLTEVAGQNDTHPLSGSHAEGRTQRAARHVLERARIAANDAALKGPHVRRVAGQNASLRWRRLEEDLHVRIERSRSRFQRRPWLAFRARVPMPPAELRRHNPAGRGTGGDPEGDRLLMLDPLSRPVPLAERHPPDASPPAFLRGLALAARNARSPELSGEPRAAQALRPRACPARDHPSGAAPACPRGRAKTRDTR